jgi:hypothetical protein
VAQTGGDSELPASVRRSKTVGTKTTTFRPRELTQSMAPASDRAPGVDVVRTSRKQALPTVVVSDRQAVWPEGSTGAVGRTCVAVVRARLAKSSLQ